LTGPLRDRQEVGFIFRGEQLGRGEGIRLEKCLNEWKGIVKDRVALDHRSLVATTINSRKPFFDPPQPITCEVPQRDVHPTLLMRNEHQADKP
jgi:hypothetical protein